MPRIMIYPKDVQRITRKVQRGVRSLIEKICQAYGKEKHQVISITEFCAYTGRPKNEVERVIGN